MNGVPVSEAELMRLFEAARWAPSCANSPALAFRLWPRRDAALRALVPTACRGQPVLVRPRRRFDRGASKTSSITAALRGHIPTTLAGMDEPGAQAR